MKEFFIILAILALIALCVNYAKNKKRKAFILRANAAAKKQRENIYSKGLKIYSFEKNNFTRKFKCFALNEENARKKYLKFLNQHIN